MKRDKQEKINQWSNSTEKRERNNKRKIKIIEIKEIKDRKITPQIYHDSA